MADSELLAKLSRRQQVIEPGLREDLETERKISSEADEELQQRLSRRQDLNEGLVQPKMSSGFKNVYAEFHEFSRKQIKDYETTFRQYNENQDGFLNFEELKRMMEKLGAPQTHLELKRMIQEVDEDKDNKISFREFLLIFRKALAGELEDDSGLMKLAQKTAIDVSKEGVGSAKNFFQAKIDQLTRTNAFEAEIRGEQEEKRKEAEEKKIRQEEFRTKKAIFN